jgi:glutamate 5-kinase
VKTLDKAMAIINLLEKESNLRLQDISETLHLDKSTAHRFLNARNTLLTLLELGIIPIINENDTVVTDEIKFGDNDNLSAMVTNMTESQILIILTDIDGLFQLVLRTLKAQLRQGKP